MLQSKLYIEENETSDDLKVRMADVGADLLIKTLEELKAGNLKPIPQNSEEATFSPPLDKLNGEIDWHADAQVIHNTIRGCNSWPIAHTRLRGKLFKIYKSKISTIRSSYPGKIVSTSPLIVGCGNNTSLELIEVQIEGKKRMGASDFARGFRLSDKVILGLVK